MGSLRSLQTQGLACTIGVLLGASLLQVGCTGPLDRTYDEAEVRRRLGPIERASLKDHALEPTITAAEAQAEKVELVTPAEPPEAVVELTLEEVRLAALKHNLGLRVDRTDPAIAAETVNEEAARFEAAFFGTTEVSSKGDYVDPTNPGVTVPEIEQWTHEVGIEVPLRTGGTAIVSASHVSKDIDWPGVPSAEQTAARFSISQPLLRDAGIEVNQAPIRIARVQGYQAQARTRLAAIRVMADAERAYWRLDSAARQVEVQRQQYEIALEQLARARRLAEEGVVAGIEAERARAGLSRRVEAVIVAETQRRQVERALKRIMNRPDLPVDGPTTLIPATSPNPIRLVLDPARFTEHAMANRMEMLELQLQMAIHALEVGVARNEMLPFLALQFDYSFRGDDDHVRGAFDGMWRRKARDWTAGAQLSIPLGNEAAEARLRQALLLRLRTTASRADRAQQIQQDVYDAIDQLEQNWKRILAAQREVVLQGRIYEAEQRQFQAGMVTMTDVLEAAAFLADAQVREVDALADYEVSKIELAFATGTVLGHGRVEWSNREYDEASFRAVSDR